MCADPGRISALRFPSAAAVACALMPLACRQPRSALASVLAAPFGTRLAHRLHGDALKWVFALFPTCVGVSLLLPG